LPAHNPLASSPAPQKKQGAYGKVKTHAAPLAASLEEALAVAAYALGVGPVGRIAPLPGASADLQWCEDMLCKVSRSFAVVIRLLPPHQRAAVGLFYLVLRVRAGEGGAARRGAVRRARACNARLTTPPPPSPARSTALQGLDTVEDDMDAFAAAPGVKLDLLRTFHARLGDADFHLDGVGSGDERALLERFGCVTRALAALPAAARAVITDVCARMGAGMADFVSRDLRNGTRDAADYDAYCHVAAGLVGEGLTALWLAAGDEAPSAALSPAVSADVGKFLQKVNM